MPADYNIPMTDAQITEALQLMVERVSEGWAQETYDGSPVGSGSPFYHKSSKYWATRSEDAAARAEAAVPASTAGAVFFDRAQTLTTAQQEQAKANISAGSTNPNLLDNPWWGSAEIVNQRGFTSGAVANGISTIDRWRSTYSGSNNTFAITANGLEISVGGVYVQYYQRFEDITRFEGKTLTASVLLSNGTIYSGTITRVNGTIQAMVPQSGHPLAVVFQSDNTLRVTAYQNITIRAVKLELGSVSTLANDAPPNYEKELAKCQYYFERISAPDGNLTLGVGCVGQQLDRAYAPIKIAPKRAKPTITMTGSARLGKYTFVEAYSFAVTALSWTAFDPKTGHGTFTAQIASASMAQSDFYRLGLMQGNTIDLSADL